MTAPTDTALWTVTESGWDPQRANYFETIFTVGNGRLGTRGSLEERHTGALPGTFLAGVYDAHDAPVTDLVNAPDWLDTEIYIEGVRLDPESAAVASHRRELDLRTGILSRETVFVVDGAPVRVRTERLASMSDRDLCALRVQVTPLERGASVVIRTGIDAHKRNLERLPAYPEGTTFGPDRKWDKWARSTHLRSTGSGFHGEVGWIGCRTIASDVDIAYAFTAGSAPAATRTRRRRGYERIGEEFEFDQTAAGTTVTVDKLVGIATDRDPEADADPVSRAESTVLRTRTFDEARAASEEAWARLWHDSDCEIVGDDRAALAVRFSIYHLLIAANPDDPTVNIGAKSLSGEGYRGHVFWDTEIMMLPFFLFTQPPAARSLLGYRFHTLPGAREVSRDNGTGGARYPWESADTGLEECPRFTPDGRNRFYTREEELHVTADVAYAVLRYAEVTGDLDYLYGEGAQILFETARFWVDRCADDGERLALRTVMGPDEFHSHIDDNAFTNRLVRWHLEGAARVYAEMADARPEGLALLAERIGLEADEPRAWSDAAGRITAPVDPDAGVIEQFEGYFSRTPVPVTQWDENDMPCYPPGYNHFNCEDTTLLKQPDVVMLMFLLPQAYSLQTRRANYRFYEPRTLHKSSLSPSIHAIVGLQVGDDTTAERYFARSAFVDLDDNQGNTEEGMHIASAGGTWQIAIHGFGGFLATVDGLAFSPALPRTWRRLRFSVHWRGRTVRADLGHEDVVLELVGAGPDETVSVWGAPVTLPAGRAVTVAASGDTVGVGHA
ncbi:glycosyl hydrolase family 65 protein [Tsukamurella sp. 8F]|uniref:glycoside hydrolase family 65 protein n=1 Tax=unclassified Tsukamurella TaxID=2633480 RepID=UPI0023BA0F50|nr:MULTISPECIES: glycosyl hydrolase family 65 protein [unclassified Tsukamurella]MDF0530426.1 glycosyl hydrolase family 65 protein [Tsukamurella sp. 8J]MDF0587753.1 glycosyl hydrolase family 65 protein [Tsukamurella sp. 8F]